MRFRVVLLCVAALAAGLPSGAHAGPDPARPGLIAPRLLPELLPADAVSATVVDGEVHASRPPRGVPQVLETAGDLSTRTNVVAGVVALIEDAWDVRLPMAAVAGAAASGSDSTARLGIAAGDLDGDGLGDAVSWDLDLADDSFSWTVVRGSDGRKLWAQESDAFFGIPVPIGDLTGDGVGEIMVVELFAEGGGYISCLASNCAWTYGEEYSWSVEVRAGRDGRTLFARVYDGTWEEAGLETNAPVIVADVTRWRATNLIVFPLPAGDLDGDGANDVAFNAFDVTHRFMTIGGGVVAGGLVWSAGDEVATRADVVSVRTGEVLFARSAPGAFGGSWLIPAGQAVGDATPDLLWQTWDDENLPTVCAFGPSAASCQDLRTMSLLVEMVDGATGATAWRVDRGDIEDGGAAFVGADLDGDGADDLWLSETRVDRACTIAPGSSDGCGWSAADGVMSGATGAVRWMRDDLFFPWLLGPVGGMPGSDLAHVRFPETVEDGTFGFDFERIDGATGATIMSTAPRFRIPDGQGAAVGAALVGDIDANGTLDLGLQMALYDPKADDWGPSVARIESGVDGTRLYRRSAPGLVSIVPAGDPDGDGRDEIYDLELVEEPGRLELVWQLRRMPRTSIIWTRRDVFDPKAAIGVFMSIGPDQSGRGGDDMIYTRVQEKPGPVIRSRIDSQEGKTGALRWRIGSL